MRATPRIGVHLAFCAILITSAATGTLAQTPKPDPTRAELENDKLREEIAKLRQDRGPLAYLPFGTVIVAVLTLGVTWLKNRSDRIRQQDEDRRQREVESLRRFDASFNTAVANLGAPQPALQTSALASLLSLFKPEYEAFHDQAFFLVLATLKIPHTQEVAQLLVKVFERGLRALQTRKEPLKVELDLARTYLNRVNLKDLDLSEVDVAWACLTNAELSGARLFRAKGFGVDLSDARMFQTNLEEARLRRTTAPRADFTRARLVSARLEESVFPKALFRQATMQSAHLNKANLKSARFEQANIDDVFFYGAEFDETALRSIVRALNWPKAHFDPPALARLQALAAPTTLPNE